MRFPAAISSLLAGGRKPAVGFDPPAETAPTPEAGVGATYAVALGVERFGRIRAAIGSALAAQAVDAAAVRLGGLVPGAGLERVSADTLRLTLEASSPEAAEAEALRLLRELEQPVTVGGGAMALVFVAGLSAVDLGEPEQAASRSEAALDQARLARRKVAVFDPAADGDPAENLALMSGLLWALRAGHVELFHQPKYDLRSRRAVAMEALVRWRHPTRGLLSPSLFIPVAEATGHIRTLTDWVLRQAIADQARMAKAGHELEVSVNISGRLLGDRDFADFVERTAPSARGGLCFEINEAAVIDNPQGALESLERFHAAGIGVSIDDFGAGLSSLVHLKQIKGCELKLDRSLVAGITESQREALVVRSAIDLAHGLGLKVTAEGVEEPAAFQLLAAMGCDSVQGYLIAKPMPLPELMGFFAEGSDLRRRFA